MMTGWLIFDQITKMAGNGADIQPKRLQLRLKSQQQGRVAGIVGNWLFMANFRFSIVSKRKRTHSKKKYKQSWSFAAFARAAFAGFLLLRSPKEVHLE